MSVRGDEETAALMVGASDEFDALSAWGLPQALPAPVVAADAEKRLPSEAKVPPPAAKGAKKPASATTPRPPQVALNRKAASARSAKETAKKPSAEVKRTPVSKVLSSRESAVKTDAKKSAVDRPLVKRESPSATRPSLTKKKTQPKTDDLNVSSSQKGAASTADGRKSTAGKAETREPRVLGVKRPAPAASTRTHTKLPPVTPFYIDLAYIPGHGHSPYVTMSFFRRCRARFYVYSAVEPRGCVLDLLLDAKVTWDDENAEVTVIPTYDTDELRAWMRENQARLLKLHVDVAPAANRCTIQLQDHETACAAYRLEF